MPSVKLTTTYDGFSSGDVIPVSLHEARVLVAAGTGADATPLAISADSAKGLRQRKGHDKN